jgi:hypothetical protein
MDDHQDRGDRGRDPHWGVFWVNLLLGWTIVGWIVALVMSLRSQRVVIIG